MNRNANSLGIFTESVKNVACPSCNAELDVSEFNVFEEISCPSCNEKFQVPGRLGGFILIEELGRGAMGCVYLAMDESLKRLVALKVIRKEYGSDPKMLETVQREAQAMATLNHRNIVQVYAFGRVNEQPYFVMELLEGERLDEMMEGGNKISEIRALEIALDVAQGLDAADKAGLTHGDIKPANILMNEHGVAKVVDFGLARFMEPGAEIEVWGTPYYIAPEKARKKGEDSRSDQYSLGGTIFHSLAGQPPFDGPNPTKVVVAALKEDTPNLLDYNENVTEKTATVIQRMMEKNPNRRYPTYASLLADLNLALIAAKEAEAEKVLAEQRLHEKQNKKMNPLIPIILVITLIVCAVIGFVVWKQSQGPATPISASYSGPPRTLIEQFTTPEIRNFKEAVSALKKGNLSLAEQKIETAERNIPDTHSAMAWANFLEAGMYFYAQYPEIAKEKLEEAAGIEDIIYDSAKAPDEDPQLLADFALGNVSAKELDKAVKKSNPYYVHMAELAKGYRLLLNGDANASGRHFKYYAQLQVQGMNWPYVLQPLASVLHVPGKKLEHKEVSEVSVKAKEDPKPSKVATPTKEVPEKAEKTAPKTAKPADLLAGVGLRNESGFPLYQTNEVYSSGELMLKDNQNANWRNGSNYALALIPNNQVLVNATGVQVLPGRAFTLIARMESLEASERIKDASDVLFHFGIFSESTDPVAGVVIDIPPSSNSGNVIRVRCGDGKTELLNKSFKTDVIRPGAYQVFSVSWDAYRSDEKTPSNVLTLYVGSEKIGEVKLDNALLEKSPRSNLVSIGTGIGKQPFIGWEGKSLRKSKVVIFDRALSEQALNDVVGDLF